MFQAKLGLGLKKIYQYFIKRLNQIKATHKSIAEGFATGVAISFTPFVGFHLLIALGIAKKTKENKIAASLGTLAGNPWSFPLIWYATFHVGNFILQNPLKEEDINFKSFFREIYQTMIMLDFSAFLRDIWPIFWTMLIGSVPFYIIVWFLVSRTLLKTLSLKRTKEMKNDFGNRMRHS